MNMTEIARRNLRQFLSKASFSSAVDKQAAFECLDALELEIDSPIAIAELQAQPSAPANPNAMQFDLTSVIAWLEAGCDPKHAASELRLYRDQMNATPADMPASDAANKQSEPMHYYQGDGLDEVGPFSSQQKAWEHFKNDMNNREALKLSKERNVVFYAAAPKECATAFPQEPLMTLILGGIDGEEYAGNDVEWHHKAIEALQDKLVKTDKEVYLPLYAAPQQPVAANIEAAAKQLSDVMDYPWEFMPEEGRANMRKNAIKIIESASTTVMQVEVKPNFNVQSADFAGLHTAIKIIKSIDDGEAPEFMACVEAIQSEISKVKP